MSDINNFFNAYLTKNSLFKDKSVLLSTYVPEEILYRDEFLKEVANVLAPALRMEKPSNLFIYGKTGTGKTLSVCHVLHTLESVAK
ncbi:cell division control protein Cdc6, partial [Candidatus Woesearchaeota archaeon]|nr:cell division control protein Cdc6 [Candidatus Woesearchaeota archaeon]